MNQEKIAQFIKKIRQENHQTQKEFAEKYNVSFQAVSKWETGKNIPDIALLKQICQDNNISIDELLGTSTPKQANKKKTIIITSIVLVVLCIALLSLLFIHFHDDSNFEFKTLSTSCSNFKITGSAAYNKHKSSIYISNIEFCGTNENTKYKELEYILYEHHKDIDVKISSGNKQQDITLIDYIKDLKININDYSQVCKSFAHSELYLEINATDDNNKITTYKIPLSLEDNCK